MSDPNGRRRLRADGGAGDLDFATLAERFFELEADLSLLDRRIGGVFFWERIRFFVHKYIASAHGIGASGGGGEDVEEYLRGTKLLLKNAVHRNPFLSSDADLLFYGKGRRKRLDDGLWWDIYVDPIANELDADPLCLERPYEVTHFTPAKTSQLRYTDLVQYAGTALEKLGVSRVALTSDERELLGDVREEIRGRFQVEVSLEEMVVEDLSLRRVRLPLYERVIDRVEPNVAFLTAAYNGRETFVEACRRCGVPVVELQHGVLNRYHMGYSFPNRQKHVFPDYFFGFGEYWAEVADLPLPDDRFYAVGYPFLEHRSRSVENRRDSDDLLVISQPEVGKSLASFALELTSRDNFDDEIFFKLHPKEFDGAEKRYAGLVNSGITLVREDPTLYELFGRCGDQVGVNSTALYEGLSFDLHTCVLDASGSLAMAYLVDEGFATEISTVDDFVAARRSISSESSEFDASYFFESNPIARFETAVADITGRDS